MECHTTVAKVICLRSTVKGGGIFGMDVTDSQPSASSSSSPTSRSAWSSI